MAESGAAGEVRIGRRQLLRGAGALGGVAVVGAPALALGAPAGVVQRLHGESYGGDASGADGVVREQGTALHQLHGPADDASQFGSGFWSAPRSVWMRRPATGEQIRLTYWANGQLIHGEYERACWFMRDVQMQARIDSLIASGRAVPSNWYAWLGMSQRLLDILYALGAWLEWYRIGRPLVLTSAFRHPHTNAGTEGAARNSKHQSGGAADIVVPDVSSDAVGRFGLWLRGGGVGFYPDRNFTHVDDGAVRAWVRRR